MTYDIAIIGAGPAGVSAAINAKILDKSFIWLSNGLESKKVSKAEKIRNYPGLPDISGEDLAAALRAHCEAMGIAPVDAKVSAIYPSKTKHRKFSILAGDDVSVAKSVILCLGVESFRPIEGELEFVGKGISYCATCDGFLYRGKTIAVLCTDKRMEHEVDYLARLASKVYLMPMYPGCEVSGENIEIIQKFPQKFAGDVKLRKVIFKGKPSASASAPVPAGNAGNADNTENANMTASNSEMEIDVDGAFLLKESVPHASLIQGLAMEDCHIAVSRDCATNISGVFAAGDCTGRPYQYAKAVGEGNVAVHSAVQYLAEEEKD